KNKYTHPNYPKVYLTLPLANRLLKEGRMGTSYRGDGYLSIKNFYIETVEELLGSCVTTSRNFYDVIGIVDSDVECILYTDSYFITSTSALPYSIYKKYNPDAPLLENGRVLILGPTEYQIGDLIFEFLSNDESYIVQGIYDSVLTLDDKNVQYVVSDYNYYEKNLPSFFYTTNLEEVTSILEEENVLYQLTAVNIYESIDSGLNQLNTIFLSVMSVLLIFTLFFIILATANYITHQIWDIIILRNMGITKTTVVHTYAIKLILKLLPSFIVGYILSILVTLYLKTFSYQTSFAFEMNPITLLLSLVIGGFTLSIAIYLYLLKRFSSTATTLKTINKI
ncbi:MAG: ABC transporter permease, partial [Anaeroplasmataceae bacterium]|nr:ABC transporter permease [Anaeroplasmataceae bacterium]